MEERKMNEDDIRVPVYLVTGFLEGGKTTFLRFTIAQDYFKIDEPTLLIVTEEGLEEYDEKELLRNNTVMTVIENKEELTYETLVKLERKYRPSRVLVEFNPFWSVAAFEEMKMPDGWGIVQEIVNVDASCFQVYMQNMKSLFVEMAKNADMVTFNRCTDDLPLANFRRSIKVVNPGCEVLFEDMNNELTDIFEDSVPYDLDAPVINIDDVDFGIFYVDAGENKERYDGKKIHFKGKVLKSRKPGADYFVAGRRAMTCCADDTAFIGYVCKWKDSKKLTQGEWVEVDAEVAYRELKIYDGEGPVFYVTAVRPSEAPEHELVYFS